VELTAVKNPDGSLVAVLQNSGQKDASYAIRINGRLIRIQLPAKTISSLSMPLT